MYNPPVWGDGINTVLTSGYVAPEDSLTLNTTLVRRSILPNTLGYLAGEFPGGLTTVDKVPVVAEVIAKLRQVGYAEDGEFWGSTVSAEDGTWRIDGLDVNLTYDVICRKPGFNDLIMASVSPVPIE